ncbi:MAG: hypothetical protein AB9834_06315 [Lentimicrobium sp.]
MKKLIIVASLIIAPLAFSFAQPQPGNNSGGTPVGGEPIGGGTAPIGGGITILLTLAAGYGAKKVFDAKNKLVE